MSDLLIFSPFKLIMAIPFYWIDSFASEHFGGNPAGVCILTKSIADAKMQIFAREMGLSETAFVLQEGDSFKLRWFTPTTEVDLCGHATLASAHALWESKLVAGDKPISFTTKSGILRAEKKGPHIFLNFPSLEVSTLPEAPKHLLENLGIKTPVYIGTGSKALLIEVESEEILRSIRPNFELLKQVPIDGIIVTSLATNKEYDFVSRYFGPREGINEDPVTGFAHCHLGPYWKNKLQKNDFYAYQASSRGGFLKVSVLDNRVSLGGNAVTIMCANISSGVL